MWLPLGTGQLHDVSVQQIGLAVSCRSIWLHLVLGIWKEAVLSFCSNLVLSGRVLRWLKLLTGKKKNHTSGFKQVEVVEVCAQSLRKSWNSSRSGAWCEAPSSLQHGAALLLWIEQKSLYVHPFVCFEKLLCIIQTNKILILTFFWV